VTNQPERGLLSLGSARRLARQPCFQGSTSTSCFAIGLVAAVPHSPSQPLAQLLTTSPPGYTTAGTSPSRTFRSLTRHCSPHVEPGSQHGRGERDKGRIPHGASVAASHLASHGMLDPACRQSPLHAACHVSVYISTAQRTQPDRTAPRGPSPRDAAPLSCGGAWRHAGRASHAHGSSTVPCGTGYYLFHIHDTTQLGFCFFLFATQTVCPRYALPLVFTAVVCRV
jgi:hypothetical protein